MDHSYARTGSISSKSITLSFTVKEKVPIPETIVLEVESYPTAVQITPGKSKEINFIIFNPSSTPAITSIELSGLPDGVSLDTEILETIPAKSRKTITALLIADKSAEFSESEVSARIQAFDLSQTKRFTLTVGQQQGFLEGIISGFLTLGESVWLGVIALIIIIVILILFGKLAGNGKPKEAWAAK